MMMQSKASIDQYIVSLFDNLSTHLQALHQKISKQNTRQVRTTIKQIRACLDFAEHMGKPYESEDFASLLTLYKRIGAYRTRQISEKRSAPFAEELGEKRYQKYLTYLQDQKKLCSKQLIEDLAGEIPSLVTMQAHISNIFATTTKRDLGMYRLTYKERHQSIVRRILKKKKIKDEDIHLIRKGYKKLLYISSMIVTHNRNIINACDLFQKQIGRRNDHIDLLEVLYTYEKKHASKKVEVLIKKIKKISKQEKNSIVDSLHLANKEHRTKND